jgi:YHS domain-containing protein
MIRFILLSILLTILFRAVARLWAGVVRGMRDQDVFEGQSRGGGGSRRPSPVPQRGVQMVRDPVCGTFVVPERALAVSGSGGERVYFCSTECRDKYRARPDADSSPAHGRTA